MKWTIREIREHPEEIVPFDETPDIKAELIQRDDSIIDVEPVRISGYFVEVDESFLLHAEVEATLTVPSSRSLKPVTIELNVPIRERYVYPNSQVAMDTTEEVVLELEEEAIDLAVAAIDAILLNIPMQVLAPEEEQSDLPSGSDWTVLTEEAFIQQKEQEKAESIDPRFASLKTLLEQSDTSEGKD